MEDRQFNVDMRWDPQADITLKGYEWEDISAVLQFFQNAMISYNSIVARNIATGIIKLRYLYTDDGTEVPPEEVHKRQEAQMREYQDKLKNRVSRTEPGS
jgi:hypothetical protein